jgi:glycogen debranching enzyme
MIHATALKRDPESTSEQIPEHYVEPQTSLVERALRTLKFGDAFAVLDSYGDVGVIPDSPEGLFMRDTRYLSRFDLRFEGKRPHLLGSVVEDDNASLAVDLTNPDIHRGDDLVIPRDIIAIERTKLLFQGACYERIGFSNFDGRDRSFRVTIGFEADFHDLFEVRGSRRPARGTSTARVLDKNRVELRYEGLDKIVRRTQLIFDPAPKALDRGLASFDLTLKPGETTFIYATVACAEGHEPKALSFATAVDEARRDLLAITEGIVTVESSDVLLNEIMCRSTSDIYMLVSRTDVGLYPYAGIPWFSTVFGRDGIITAMMMLWVDPAIARGVLLYLAKTQATTIDPEADAQPGKILHETRHGEMARLKEVPFGFYYGTVDATPLFVMLAGAYFEQTGDRATIETIWRNIEAALTWCDTFGDKDGDGFVEYYRETDSGLANQGWKDSNDSIFHADGSDAKGPIALCEVQGYVYAAKHAAADLARVLGHDERAAALAAQADALKVRFHEAFWSETIGTYALALDGAKKPCEVRSSNAGHTLFTGIADASVAARVADVLTDERGFSAWGIRTIAEGEPRYNPMSYHNGSVWPHDNALVVLGFARYGLKDHATKVFAALFDASGYQELRRLPELFCGFPRRARRGPTAYPVACAPQAWASATPFALLAACLGLRLDHASAEISFTDPHLPEFLDELVIRGLRLGSATADLRLQRSGADVTVSVIKRHGAVRIVQVK